MNRIAIVLSGCLLPDAELLARLRRSNNELVVILAWRNFDYCLTHNKKPGEVLVMIKKYFDNHWGHSFCIFPIDATSLSAPQLLIKISHLSPPFNEIMSDSGDIVSTSKLLLNINSYLCEFDVLPEDVNDNIQRSLFITRAQLFHNGHVEILNNAFNDCDEAIIIVACAEQSFKINNPATAGERISIIRAYMENRYPQKYWIAPFAYNPNIAENFKEILWLMPHFHSVITTNEQVEQMAKFEKLRVTVPMIKSPVRGFFLRDQIASGDDCRELMPAESVLEMKNLGIDKRIIELTNSKEA